MAEMVKLYIDDGKEAEIGRNRIILEVAKINSRVNTNALLGRVLEPFEKGVFDE